MMAANYRHIGGPENRLGRHYSRLRRFWPAVALADQSLAPRKSQNAGSNRRSWAKLQRDIPPGSLEIARRQQVRALATGLRQQSVGVASSERKGFHSPVGRL